MTDFTISLTGNTILEDIEQYRDQLVNETMGLGSLNSASVIAVLSLVIEKEKDKCKSYTL